MQDPLGTERKKTEKTKASRPLSLSLFPCVAPKIPWNFLSPPPSISGSPDLLLFFLRKCHLISKRERRRRRGKTFTVWQKSGKTGWENIVEGRRRKKKLFNPESAFSSLSLPNCSIDVTAKEKFFLFLSILFAFFFQKSKRRRRRDGGRGYSPSTVPTKLLHRGEKRKEKEMEFSDEFLRSFLLPLLLLSLHCHLFSPFLDGFFPPLFKKETKKETRGDIRQL